MLEHGAFAAEVLKHFLPTGELAKFNPRHLGPGPGGGQFTTAEMDTASAGDTKPTACAVRRPPSPEQESSVQNSA